MGSFCTEHWDALRGRIEDRGLLEVSSVDGRDAAARMRDQVDRGEATIKNFDPLLDAHWAIYSNVMSTIGRAGGDGLYFFSEGPLDKVDPVMVARARSNGVEVPDGLEWPKCPLCYLNLAHELTCTDKRCTLPKKGGYDFFLDRAADDAQRKLEDLRAET